MQSCDQHSMDMMRLGFPADSCDKEEIRHAKRAERTQRQNMSVQERIVFEIGEWTVDSLAHSLSYGDEEHQVPAKVMAVLVYLAQNHERLVTREELIDAVWDGNAYVGEKALNNAIWRIRQVFDLGDEGTELVKTTPKTGYQLLAAPAFSRFENSAVDSPGGLTPLGKYLLVAAAVLAIAAIAALAMRDSPVRMIDEPLAVVTQLPGRELYAATSPDGAMFAFLHVSQQGTQDLYVQSLQNPGRQPTKFTSSDASNFAPTWAPDSSHIAYIRIDDTTLNCEIVVRDLNSNSEEVIDVCVDVGYTTLSWSPDGLWLVYRKDDPVFGPGL